MRSIKIVFSFILCAINLACYASIDDILGDIDQYTSKISGFDSQISTYTQTMSQSLIGNYNMGGSNFTDYQGYGSGGDSWSNILNMVKSGGSGNLASLINALSGNYSNQTKAVNGVVTDQATQEYYAQKAQNSIAAQAAAEEDFNKIQQQLDYQDKLRSMIDKTTNIKEATDLMNRLQVESNRIQLELMRGMAVANQIHAIDSQGEVNDAALNANLLTWSH